MKVRFLESVMTQTDAFGRGQIVNLTAKEALHWVEKKMAVLVENDPELKQTEPVIQEIRRPKGRPVRRKNDEV
jgi:hypothetical protein